MQWCAIGARFGFLGVLSGAFGAHGLHETLTAAGRLDTWEKAVFYHLVHAVVLLAISWRSATPPRVACWALTVGIAIFSGSLYLLCLSGVKMWGAVTPLGGLAFLVGWGALCSAGEAKRMKIGFAAIVLLATGPVRGEGPAWERVDPIPQRLPTVRDRSGYSWQLTAAGSFSFFGRQCLRFRGSGVHPRRAFRGRTDGTTGNRYAFTGRCGADWALRREVWIDPERAAAIRLEEAGNESAQRREIVLEVATHFPDAMAELVGPGRARPWSPSASRPAAAARFLSFTAAGRGERPLLFAR